MSDVHQCLHNLRLEPSASQEDRYKAAASELAKEPVLFLDELEVTDIADASILKRLFEALRSQGTLLVLTSNRAPEDLYKGGLNYSRFQPSFSKSLRKMVDVVDLDGPRDYREFAPESASDSEATARHLFDPPRSLWKDLTASSLSPPAPTKIPVSAKLTRTVPVPLAQKNEICKFTYAQLAGPNSMMSGSCYSALSNVFDVVVLEGLPPLESRDDMRRFTLFVDVMYERRKILVVESPLTSYDDTIGSNAVSSEEVFIKEEGGGELECLEEGGSSGRLTTMFGDNLEWSATGRFGASLLDITDGDFSRSAFQRCRSRMGEMMRVGWVDKAEVGGGLKERIRGALGAGVKPG
ncbi:hypothetical protein TrRE_jg12892 [Triparma retinervis]|uniref:Uncharacterized protein n=1 Tax=Triparma retinervis TaxID=2557542 RepID=A0A9W6ZQP1_9STRA|nr:hypothetical protein TrRE_jg12892 [Triparma retinervis]